MGALKAEVNFKVKSRPALTYMCTYCTCTIHVRVHIRILNSCLDDCKSCSMQYNVCLQLYVSQKWIHIHVHVVMNIMCMYSTFVYMTSVRHVYTCTQMYLHTCTYVNCVITLQQVLETKLLQSWQ